MIVTAVTMEGLPAEEHRLSRPPSSVRFGPHGSERLPSNWDKLTQDPELGTGEQPEERTKGSVQLLALAGMVLLSMVPTALVSSRQDHPSLGDSGLPGLLPLALAGAAAPAVSHQDQFRGAQRSVKQKRRAEHLTISLLVTPSHLRSTQSRIPIRQEWAEARCWRCGLRSLEGRRRVDFAQSELRSITTLALESKPVEGGARKGA